MTPQRPDWAWHNIHTDEPHLLDTLRTEAPILWALTIGHRTSITIANALGMPLEVIRYELRRYKQEGYVQDVQAPASVVWKLIEDPNLLRQWVKAQQQKNRILDDQAEDA